MKTALAKQEYSGNPNHPQRGSSTIVEPIRDEKNVWAIRKILVEPPPAGAGGSL